MIQESRSLDPTDRAASALFGVSFSILALRRGHPLWRVLCGVAGIALLGRSLSGAAAYQGVPPGVGLDAVDEAVNDSFPASDPPASRLADVPPANAEAKWDAIRDKGKLEA
jgi:hypothetical protein